MVELFTNRLGQNDTLTNRGTKHLSFHFTKGLCFKQGFNYSMSRIVLIGNRSVYNVSMYCSILHVCPSLSIMCQGLTNVDRLNGIGNHGDVRLITTKHILSARGRVLA